MQPQEKNTQKLRKEDIALLGEKHIQNPKNYYKPSIVIFSPSAPKNYAHEKQLITTRFPQKTNYPHRFGMPSIKRIFTGIDLNK